MILKKDALMNQQWRKWVSIVQRILVPVIIIYKHLEYRRSQEELLVLTTIKKRTKTKEYFIEMINLSWKKKIFKEKDWAFLFLN